MNEMIIHGDCLEKMKDIETDTVDLVLTDPPYGYSFMGKDWDKAVPSIDIWKECLRVLKPGAFCFVMSAPRQDVLSRMIVNLEWAGFNMGFTSIYWAYASGFPKAGNVGKLVDKKAKKKTEYYDLAKFLKDARFKKEFCQSEIAGLFLSKTGGKTGCVWNWENGLNVPTKEQWIKLKKKLSLDNSFDWLIEKETKRYEAARREIISKTPMTIGIGGAAKRMGSEKVIDKPSTDSARALDGSYTGFQPKPAVEIIIIAMKPLSEKTYVDQALKNQKGVTWLDDGRIPYDKESDDTRRKAYPTKGWCLSGSELSGSMDDSALKGRFPANLLVSDDVLNDGKETKSVGGIQKAGNTNKVYGKYDKETYTECPSDSGSFSRYFDLDAWALENGFPQPDLFGNTDKGPKDVFPFMIVAKENKAEKNRGLDGMDEKQVNDGRNKLPDNAFQRGKSFRKNIHPTVKPLKLMAYLITLASRPGDTILDPFMGSGTTGVACALKKRKFIGIELDENYFQIAKKRIEKETHHK